MISYIVRRLVQVVPLAFASTVLVFVMIHLMPGDPAYIPAGDNATQGGPECSAAPARTRPQSASSVRVVGQSTPAWESGHLDAQSPANCKASSRSRSGDARVDGRRDVPAILLALPIGMLGATHSHGKLDVVISSLQSVWLAIPSFWAGILGIVLFAILLHWLPPGGRVSDANDLGGSIKSLLLPACCLALYIAAGLSRIVRANMLEVYADDYVRTARAKGLAERRVAYGHAMRNALIPVVTVLGLQFAGLLGGTVVIESVFSWPGVGTLMLDAITSRDYAVVQAGLLFMVLLFIAINLIVDLSYVFIDPRLRLGGGG